MRTYNTQHFRFFKALVLDLNGEGVNFDNLWSGDGMPLGGSLIMMTLDIFLYGLLAYYLDSVVPSEYIQYKRIKRTICKKKIVRH